MDKSMLTQAVIQGCIAGTDGGDQNYKIVKALAIIMLILGFIGLLFPIITVICWGIALLAAYMDRKAEGETLEDYLSNRVFQNAASTTLSPNPEGVKGFQAYLDRYQAALAAQKAASSIM